MAYGTGGSMPYTGRLPNNNLSSLSVESIQFFALTPISLTTLITLPSRLCPGLPRDTFSVDLPVKIRILLTLVICMCLFVCVCARVRA